MCSVDGIVKQAVLISFEFVPEFLFGFYRLCIATEACFSENEVLVCTLLWSTF